MKSLKMETIKIYIQLQIEKTKDEFEKDEAAKSFSWGKESAYKEIMDYIKKVEEME